MTITEQKMVTQKKEKKMESKVETQPEKETQMEKKEEAHHTHEKAADTGTAEQEKKVEKKPVVEKRKKSEAVVTADNIPMSTKHSAAICYFIKNKKIEDAISDLEAVLRFKKAVPMTGEIPHRKGKGMMSGRFPKKASENFIRLLKSLNANSNYNGMTNPVIVEAVANIGVRPFGRFGAVRKKRTHIKIVAKEMQEKKIKKENK